MYLAHHLRRVAAAQQRAFVGAAHALNQHIQITIEPDCQPTLKDDRTRFFLCKSAAAGRNHPIGCFEQPCDHAAFAIAKILFAKGFEDIGNGHIGCFDNLIISIGEGYFQRIGEPSPDARFAHAHHADQHQRAVHPLAQRAQLVRISERGRVAHCRMAYR